MALCLVPKAWVHMVQVTLIHGCICDILYSVFDVPIQMYTCVIDMKRPDDTTSDSPVYLLVCLSVHSEGLDLYPQHSLCMFYCKQLTPAVNSSCLCFLNNTVSHSIQSWIHLLVTSKPSFVLWLVIMGNGARAVCCGCECFVCLA